MRNKTLFCLTGGQEAESDRINGALPARNAFASGPSEMGPHAVNYATITIDISRPMINQTLLAISFPYNAPRLVSALSHALSLSSSL